jgi:hypothetical protein
MAINLERSGTILDIVVKGFKKNVAIHTIIDQQVETIVTYGKAIAPSIYSRH